MLTLSTEEKQFISRLEDRLERVETRYQEEVTDFLEPRLQLVADEYLRSKKIKRYYADLLEKECGRLLIVNEDMLAEYGLPSNMTPDRAASIIASPRVG